MFEWLTGGLKTVVADLAVVKADLELAQATITKLTGGYLTAQSELAILRAALEAAGVKVPAFTPATDLEVRTFLYKVKTQVDTDAASPYQSPSGHQS